MCDPYFPDSNLNIRDGYANLVNDSSHAKIYPHQSGLFSGHQCAEDIFNPTNGKTMIFIFDANTIENTPWSEVIANNLYIKRYDLNFRDLDSLGWEINYP